MKNKLKVMLLLACATIAFAGCNKNESSSVDSTEEVSTEATTKKYTKEDAFDYEETVGMTVKDLLDKTNVTFNDAPITSFINTVTEESFIGIIVGNYNPLSKQVEELNKLDIKTFADIKDKENLVCQYVLDENGKYSLFYFSYPLTDGIVINSIPTFEDIEGMITPEQASANDFSTVKDNLTFEQVDTYIDNSFIAVLEDAAQDMALENKFVGIDNKDDINKVVGDVLIEKVIRVEDIMDYAVANSAIIDLSDDKDYGSILNFMANDNELALSDLTWGYYVNGEDSYEDRIFKNNIVELSKNEDGTYTLSSYIDIAKYPNLTDSLQRILDIPMNEFVYKYRYYIQESSFISADENYFMYCDKNISSYATDEEYPGAVPAGTDSAMYRVYPNDLKVGDIVNKILVRINIIISEEDGLNIESNEYNKICSNLQGEEANIYLPIDDTFNDIKVLSWNITEFKALSEFSGIKEAATDLNVFVGDTLEYAFNNTYGAMDVEPGEYKDGKCTFTFIHDVGNKYRKGTINCSYTEEDAGDIEMIFTMNPSALLSKLVIDSVTFEETPYVQMQSAY